MLPELAVEIYTRFQAGDMDGAREHQDHLNQAIRVMFDHDPTVMNALKAILERLGFKVHKCREPFTPMSADRIENMMRDLTEIGFFNWVKV